MTKALERTPTLIESIKTMAYLGLSQREIAQRVKKAPNTLFLYREGEDNVLLEAYNEGKSSHKAKLLADMAELGDTAKSEEVVFKVKKYELNVHHKVMEDSKPLVEITGDINAVINIGTPDSNS